MSVKGHKRTWDNEIAMSALPPKPDIDGARWNFRFVPTGDIQATVEYDYTRKDAQIHGAS
jgi:hypothetical protein